MFREVLQGPRATTMTAKNFMFHFFERKCWKRNHSAKTGQAHIAVFHNLPSNLAYFSFWSVSVGALLFCFVRHATASSSRSPLHIPFSSPREVLFLIKFKHYSIQDPRRGSVYLGPQSARSHNYMNCF